jgi:L-lactate dehydrogenase complex protein LldG
MEAQAEGTFAGRPITAYRAKPCCSAGLTCYHASGCSSEKFRVADKERSQKQAREYRSLTNIKTENAMTREDVTKLFIDNASRAAAETWRVASGDELNKTLEPILNESESIYCQQNTDKEKLIIIPANKRVDDYTQASVCIDEVTGAIAETGSLICSSQHGKPVQAGLLPAHHVAIVPSENIYETLDDYFGTLGDTPPTNITLETGPSRTADIELTLTIGVHGPGRLTVIVY